MQEYFDVQSTIKPDKLHIMGESILVRSNIRETQMEDTMMGVNEGEEPKEPTTLYVYDEARYSLPEFNTIYSEKVGKLEGENEISMMATAELYEVILMQNDVIVAQGENLDVTMMAVAELYESIIAL